MSDSVTTSVDLSVSPDVAFDVFVREIDAWYQVDRRALPDLTRTAAIRFEPRLGGRLIDVHDLATGEGRELGRITTWELGHRLVLLDNEGTEVDVSFEGRGEGTRVTLTHRGLDRLAPGRAAALRRTGWRALTLLYRDHLAPNARPVALAAGSMAVSMAAALAVFAVVQPSPGWLAAGTLIVVLGIMFAVTRIERRVARRWVASSWGYRRIQIHVFVGLTVLGLMAWSLYDVFANGDDWSDTTLPLLPLLALVWCSAEQNGPAGGRPLRKRAHPPRRPPPPAWSGSHLLLLAGLAALVVGALLALDSVAPRLLNPAVALIYAVGIIAFVAYTLLSRHRKNKTLGFNPDFYVGVERRIDDENRRPELLIHRPTEKPGYSGWYAYANERDERRRDLVAWSVQDLIDHSPEAAHPLREGHGKWRWDQHLGAYKPVEEQTEAAV